MVKFDGGWKAHDVVGSDDSLYLVGDFVFIPLPLFDGTNVDVSYVALFVVH